MPVEVLEICASPNNYMFTVTITHVLEGRGKVELLTTGRNIALVITQEDTRERLWTLDQRRNIMYLMLADNLLSHCAAFQSNFKIRWKHMTMSAMACFRR